MVPWSRAEASLDRWTYWEKFDYWASFCGVGVIGTSGLVLWFPEFFTNFFPGWVVNVAIIIHSDGALLASAFIFTIHFFHTHLRPEKFPMDTAIFIGRLTLDEMERDRPIEYERLTKEGKMGERMISPPSPWLTTTGILFGELLLLMGFALLFLILVGEFFS